MPIPIRAAVTVAATPEQIYPWLSDLTKHGDWSKSPLTVTANGDGTFVSNATFMRKPVQATLTPVSDEPASRYVFDVQEPKHTIRHEFLLTTAGSGTTLQRTIFIPDDGNAVQRFFVRTLIGPTAIKSDIAASLKKLKGMVEAG